MSFTERIGVKLISSWSSGGDISKFTVTDSPFLRILKLVSSGLIFQLSFDFKDIVHETESFPAVIITGTVLSFASAKIKTFSLNLADTGGRISKG